MERTIDIDRAVEIKTENLKMLEAAKSFSIVNQETYESVVEQVKKVKDRRRWWLGLVKPVKESARSAWQKVIDLEKEIDNPLAVMENEILKPKLVAWEILQEGKRRVEQEKIAAELRHQEEDQRLKMAMELEKNGNMAAAEAVIEAPMISPAIEIPKTTAVKGMSYRDQYSAVVVDMKAFIQAVHEGKIPMEAVSPNGAFLNIQARAFKGALNYAGIQVKVNRIAAVGGRF